MGLQACQRSFERIEAWEADHEPLVASDIYELRAPEGFDFATAHGVELELSSVRPTDGQPHGGVAVSLWTEGATGQLVELGRGVTDAPVIVLPGDDRDGDGVTNEDDLYPDDIDRAFELYAPAKG